MTNIDLSISHRSPVSAALTAQAPIDLDSASYRIERGLRHMPAIIGAGVVTALLFVLMQSLISEDFVPQDVIDIKEFQINPVIVEPPLLIRQTKPEPLQPIEVPPAPPRNVITKAGKPDTPIITVTEVTIPPQPTDLNLPTTITAISRDPQPIVRIAPAMPQRADRSGHCLINFDISADGKPFNVRAQSCSQSLFERAATRAVQSWTYRPEVSGGKAVTRRGLQTRITFNLTDEHGRIIPE